MEKNNTNDDLSSKIEYLNMQLKQRFGFFSLYVFIFTSMCVGVYFAVGREGFCEKEIERVLVLFFSGVSMSVITLIFYFLLKNVNFNIKNIKKSITKISNNGLGKAISKDKNYPCLSQVSCINLMILLSWVFYIILLIPIWYNPNCNNNQTITTKSTSSNCSACKAEQIKGKTKFLIGPIEINATFERVNDTNNNHQQ